MRDFDVALDAVIAAAQTEPWGFTTDDVWPQLRKIPSERNVIGKAFSEAARRGIIVGTERFVKSARPESKGRRVQVWQAGVMPEALF